MQNECIPFSEEEKKNVDNLDLQQCKNYWMRMAMDLY